MHQLRLGALDFDGGVGLPTPYTLAYLNGISGVEIRRGSQAREFGHGSFPESGFFETKRIEWGGLILTDTWLEQDHAIASLGGMRGVSGLTRLVSQGARRLWADVQRVSIPDPVILVPGQVASYKCEVEVPGVFLFSETNTFSGSSVQVFHYGNADAVPDVTVVGPRAAYTISGPGGQLFSVSQALTAGQTHRIDFAQGWVYRDGVLQQGAVARAETFTIPPGSSSVMSISSGSMTVKVLDTFS